MYGIGLMSGTSLDGIDAALCEITGHGKNTKVRLVEFITHPMSSTLIEKIRKACFKETSSVDLICSLNFEIGYAFSAATKALLEKANMTSDQIDFIASHGQTIWHQPIADEDHVESTLQIGEAAVIAYEHNCQVISNFRVMDMAAGGQGAPLVPYSEYVLYSQENKNICLLNLGGIGNITWLNGSMDPNQILAFDTGPANMMINAAMKKLYGKSYDDGGKVGASGHLIPELLSELQSDGYFELEPPKSTGRELFGEDRTLSLIDKYSSHPSQDIVHTFTYFTAWCVAYHVKKYLCNEKALDLLLVGGGGAHNLTIMKMLSDLLDGVDVLSQDDYGYSADAKEAIAFVVLGNETLHGGFSNIKSATGSRESVVLGNITPKPKVGG